nr:ABC transporter ATP-binding protein [Nocardiopsis sp. MG754419]
MSGLSFDVKPGELFSLLGTNGAGKTTTIEVLEGFSRPSSGSVSVLGEDPYGRPPRLRALTNAVLQHSGTFPELTVRETVELGRGLCKRPRGRDELLERVGLAHRSRVWVRDLSGGEQRRLDLCLALVNRPRVLFLDEPTTGMDPEGRQDVWQVLTDVLAEGTTVLLTTHYLEEAERLSDRLAIMHAGERRIAGTVDEVVSQWGDRVEFALTDDVREEDLPRVPGASFADERIKNQRRAVYTLGDGTGPERLAGSRRQWAHTATKHLLDWAEGQGVRLSDLRVRSASLEDVFLEIAKEGSHGE